jgi:hypothetical protein
LTGFLLYAAALAALIGALSALAEAMGEGRLRHPRALLWDAPPTAALRSPLARLRWGLGAALVFGVAGALSP